MGVLDLVPIFSYLFSGGKCRYCGAKLSIRYFFSEVIGGLTYLFIVMKFGLSLECVKYLVLCSLLLCASFADLEDMIIPDRLIVLGLVNRLVFVFIEGNIKDGLLNSLIGAFCISIPMLIIVLIMERIMKREAMGGGDLKLFMMIGSYFSIGENVLSVLFACVIGLLFSVLMKKTNEEFPFGPSICLAYFLTLFVGSNILNWYFSLF